LIHSTAWRDDLGLAGAAIKLYFGFVVLALPMNFFDERQNANDGWCAFPPGRPWPPAEANLG
jgi:hypothetical protein